MWETKRKSDHMRIEDEKRRTTIQAKARLLYFRSRYQSLKLRSSGEIKNVLLIYFDC